MKRSLLLVSLLAVALPALAGGPQCTSRTTRGAWQYTCEGSVPAGFVPGAPLVPARFLGTCSSGESSFFSCLGSFNVGGFVVQQGHSLQGQAVTNDDCTGTISYATTVFGQPGPNFDIQYVVFDSGNQIAGLPVNPGGPVLSCSLHRIGSPGR